ncbi:hypothetical protein [Actinoplanes sp. OR16]|uniref:hypothetical protein n=1 Tax=Actinoplanes sp. OR16 TaxID=946334 RepID=UPI00351A90D2
MSDTRHTRRRILTATGAMMAAATLSGCGLFDDEPEPAPAPDPLQPILDEALRLAAAYDLAAQADPAMVAFAEDHRAHAAELATLFGTALPSGAPAASAPAPAQAQSKAELRAAELAAQKTAAAACVAAPADRAALVGSIAACRATHANALR